MWMCKSYLKMSIFNPNLPLLPLVMLQGIHYKCAFFVEIVKLLSNRHVGVTKIRYGNTTH